MKKITFKTLSITLLMVLSGLVNAATVVVVNSANPDSAITEKVAKKIFLGKASSTGSAEVVPVDQKEGSAIRNGFYAKVAKKDEAKMKAYWSKMIFSGKATPPEIVDDDAAVKAWLGKNKNGIGYIDSASVDGSVKVLLTIN